MDQLYQASFCHRKVCAGPFSHQTQVHTFFTQYCDWLDIWLEISLIHNLRMFLDILEFNIESKNVVIMWSQIFEQITELVHKITLQKSKEHKKNFKKNESTLFSQ